MRHTQLSDSGVMTYRTPGTQVVLSNLHRSREGFVGRPLYVQLSGAEGEELTAALALCMGGIDLMQPPTPPIRSLYTKAIAQEA